MNDCYDIYLSDVSFYTYNMVVGFTTTCAISAYQKLTLRVRIPLMARCTQYNITLCDRFCQWLAAGRWFSSGTPRFPPLIKLASTV